MSNPNPIVRKESYVKAFGSDITTLWGGTPWREEWRSLCHMRAYVCAYSKSEIYLKYRKELIYNHLDGEFSTIDASDILNTTYHQLPTNNDVPRFLTQSITQYDEPPTRVFGEPEGKVNETFNQIYDDWHVDELMNRTAKAAGIIPKVAVRPYFPDGSNELKFQTIYCDNFRVITEDDDPEHVKEMAYPVKVTLPDGTQPIRFRHWTETTVFTRDLSWGVISEEENRYKRVPFVFLGFFEESGFYGGGEWSLVEMMLKVNRWEWITDLVGGLLYPMTTVLNMGLPPHEAVPRPGRTYVKDGVTENGEGGGEPWPVVETVTPDAPIESLTEMKERYRKGNLVGLGMPSSALSEDGGSPLSGISRFIERLPLLVTTRQRNTLLRRFEEKFFHLLALVIRLDSRGRYSVPLDVSNESFSIDYKDESIILEQEAEFKHDIERLDKGLLSLPDFVRKWGDVDKAMTDEEAVEYIKKNKELRDVVYGSSRSDAEGLGGTAAENDAASATDQRGERQIEPTGNDAEDAATVEPAGKRD